MSYNEREEDLKQATIELSIIEAAEIFPKNRTYVQITEFVHSKEMEKFVELTKTYTLQDSDITPIMNECNDELPETMCPPQKDLNDILSEIETEYEVEKEKYKKLNQIDMLSGEGALLRGKLNKLLGQIELLKQLVP